MATRRTLDTRNTARALYYTNAFTAFRVLACCSSKPCPDCHGAGEICAGYSGRDDDGNAPIIERCETCNGDGF